MEVVEFKSEQHIELNNIEDLRDSGGNIPFHKIRTENLNKEETGNGREYVESTQRYFTRKGTTCPLQTQLKTK